MIIRKTLGHLGQKTIKETDDKGTQQTSNKDNTQIKTYTYNQPKPRYANTSGKIHSPSETAIWHHQNPEFLQQQKLNIPTQMKHKKTILK